ncbi:MAG: 16S rRNA (guanine(966)-N(2))-methyltransferase RsmD [Psittacicella sp.]
MKQHHSQTTIISGKFKNRKIKILDHEGLRPTLGIVKETLFNWLSFDIIDLKCLDCFSGSGSLGIEALSRGASLVDFIEIYTPAYKNIKDTIIKLSLESSSNTYNKNILDFHNDKSINYELVFLDPPFNKNLLKESIEHLIKIKAIDSNTILYIEKEISLDLKTLGFEFEILKEKLKKEFSFGLYKIIIQP